MLSVLVLVSCACACVCVWNKFGVMMKGGLCLVVLAVGSFVGLVVCTMLNGTASPADDDDDAFMPTEWATVEAGGKRIAADMSAEPAALPLRKLSRRKRYVAFPEGSSFSVSTPNASRTLCL